MSNDTIISSSSMLIFVIKLENLVKLLALLFFSLTYAFGVLAMYLLRLYNEGSLNETVGLIVTPGLRIFSLP